MLETRMRSLTPIVLAAMFLASCARCDSDENNSPTPKGDMSITSDMTSTPDMKSSEDMSGPSREDMTGVDPDMETGQYNLNITSPTVGSSIDPGALSVSVTIEPAPPMDTELVLSVDSFEVAKQNAPMGMASFEMAEIKVDHLGAAMPRQLTTKLMRGGEVLAESDPVAVTLSNRQKQEAELFANSMGNPRLEFKDGKPWLIRANTPIQAANSVERAYSFIEQYDDLIALPGDLRENYYIKKVNRDRRQLPKSDAIPLEVVQFAQRAHGIPVYSTDVTITMRGDRVLFMMGQWLGELPEMPRQHLGIADVRRIAAEKFDNVERILTPKLFFYDSSLDWDPAEGKRPEQDTRLAWRVPVFGVPSGGRYSLYAVWVDAENGAILEMQNKQMDLSVLEDDPDVEVLDYGNDDINVCPWIYDGYLWAHGGTTDCTESGCNSGAHPDSIAIQQHSLLMYDWVLFTFGFYSFDNHNQMMRSYTRVEQDSGIAAFYKPWCEFWGFGLGNTGSYTFGHEFMHGIAHHTVDMVDSYSARVTNEAIANIFGAIYTGQMIERRYACSEDFAGADVDMGPRPQNYTRQCNPDPADTTEFAADHTSEYDRNENYYYNAAIASRAIAIAIWAGEHPDSGVVIDRGVRNPEDFVLAYFDLFVTGILPDDASLSRFLTVWREHVITRPYSMTYDDACALVNGVAAVGVGVGDLDCDLTLDDVDDDLDGDLQPNDVDNCPEVRNYHQQDLDGDGLGDECDSDEDGDGVLNIVDNCREPNPRQEDRDMDGIGDACQDSDGDRIPDSLDNCPEHAAGHAIDNEDGDGDGLGNACDDDDDGDGLLDEMDNCPLESNPSQTDSDNDSVGNPCDNCPSDVNTSQLDTDNDGMGNVCDDDDDGDGYNDDVDNCPLRANDQTDTDGNGIGLACDDAEKGEQWEAGFGDGATIAVEVVEAWGLYAFPLPLCTSNCEEWFDANTTWTISLAAAAPFFAVLFNDEGEMLAAAEPGVNGVTELVFEPSQSFLSLADANPFEIVQPYTIVLIPNPDLHTKGDTFHLTMVLNSTQEPIGFDEVCGDMSKGGDEACDGGDLGGATCQSEGFTDGTLACDNSCAFDTSACTTCSNNQKEGAEVCDGSDLGGMTCVDFGYPGGTLACDSDCGGFDTSGCDLCDPFSTTDCNPFPSNYTCRSDGTCGTCTDNSECTAPFVCYNSQCQLF